MTKRIAVVAGFAVWIGATGVALGAVAEYASKPGASAGAPTVWPTASRLARSPGATTLVMIAHTKCACTRASLSELARIMAHADERSPLDAFVVFVGPRNDTSTGVFDTRATARAIPGVIVVEDESEARLFGALTSGQVVVYEPNGELVFRGGITSARGHEGDSAGNESVRRLVSKNHDFAGVPPAGSALPSTQVFGCALFDTPLPSPQKSP